MDFRKIRLKTSYLQHQSSDCHFYRSKLQPIMLFINYLQVPVTVLVSCVQKEHPFKSHAHKLVGKGFSEGGVCRVQVNPEDDMTYEFQNLKLQYVKKGDVESELKTRQKINVDPFQNGFQHSSFSLNSVRLCFQVIPTVPRAPIDIPPTVSEVIRHDKSNGELSIVHFSHNKSTMDGGKKIMLLLNAKVSRSVELHFKFLNHSE